MTIQTQTIADILATPTSTPTSRVERQVANSLVKRIMKENEGGRVIKLPNTRGKVKCYNILTTRSGIAFYSHSLSWLYHSKTPHR